MPRKYVSVRNCEARAAMSILIFAKKKAAGGAAAFLGFNFDGD
jgi:hypothetical protein